nr:ribonuclease H-like domain-containing protein [Tanacetum cinerariifolium]
MSFMFYLLQIVQICLWIIDSGCSKHMMGNCALLANFVEKFLGMIRFGNNDLVVIAGYGDVIIGSMMIKKVYYVEGLGEGYHAILPPYTRNFMPSRPDLSFAGLDDSIFKSSINKPITSVHETKTSTSMTSKESMEKPKTGNPQYTLKDQGIFDSGCSRHMTRNKSFLTDYQEINRGFVAFGGSLKGGKISRKGKIMTGKLDFEDVYFVKELKFNLFSVSQMCDKNNSVLFTKTECLVFSSDFKLLDENQVLLKIYRQNNMYSFDLKNVVPSG